MNKQLIAASIVGAAVIGGGYILGQGNSYENSNEIPSVNAEEAANPSSYIPTYEDPPTGTRPRSSGDLDCGDFDSQSEAQDFFESEGYDDPHGLDRDGDGIACESI